MSVIRITNETKAVLDIFRKKSWGTLSYNDVLIGLIDDHKELVDCKRHLESKRTHEIC